MCDVWVDTVDDPKIREGRAIIIRVTSTAIRGSNLHIHNGSLPQPTPQTLGHEFMGTVEEVGQDVTNPRRGDRVVGPFPVACGHCLFRNHDLPGHHENSNPDHYGPDGGQAECARVPYADFGPREVPDNLTDEQLNDIITHRLPRARAPHGYDIFRQKKGRLRESGAQVRRVGRGARPRP